LKIGKEVASVDFGGETLSMLGTIYKNKAQGTFVERNVSDIKYKWIKANVTI